MCFGLQGCESRVILGHDSVRRGVYPVECVCACVWRPASVALVAAAAAIPSWWWWWWWWSSAKVAGPAVCVCVWRRHERGWNLAKEKRNKREREMNGRDRDKEDRVARPGWLGVAFFLYTRGCGFGLGADKIGDEGWGMRNGVCVGFEKENRGLGCEETGAISGRHAAAG